MVIFVSALALYRVRARQADRTGGCAVATTYVPSDVGGGRGQCRYQRGQEKSRQEEQLQSHGGKRKGNVRGPVASTTNNPTRADIFRTNESRHQRLDYPTLAQACQQPLALGAAA